MKPPRTIYRILFFAYISALLALVIFYPEIKRFPKIKPDVFAALQTQNEQDIMKAASQTRVDVIWDSSVQNDHLSIDVTLFNRGESTLYVPFVMCAAYGDDGNVLAKSTTKLMMVLKPRMQSGVQRVSLGFIDGSAGSVRCACTGAGFIR